MLLAPWHLLTQAGAGQWRALGPVLGGMSECSSYCIKPHMRRPVLCDVHVRPCTWRWRRGQSRRHRAAQIVRLSLQLALAARGGGRLRALRLQRGCGLARSGLQGRLAPAQPGPPPLGAVRVPVVSHGQNNSQALDSFACAPMMRASRALRPGWRRNEDMKTQEQKDRPCVQVALSRAERLHGRTGRLRRPARARPQARCPCSPGASPARPRAGPGRRPLL